MHRSGPPVDCRLRPAAFCCLGRGPVGCSLHQRRPAWKAAKRLAMAGSLEAGNSRRPSRPVRREDVVLIFLWGVAKDPPMAAVREQLRLLGAPTVFADQGAVLETEIDL